MNCILTLKLVKKNSTLYSQFSLYLKFIYNLHKLLFYLNSNWFELFILKLIRNKELKAFTMSQKLNLFLLGNNHPGINDFYSSYFIISSTDSKSTLATTGSFNNISNPSGISSLSLTLSIWLALSIKTPSIRVCIKLHYVIIFLILSFRGMLPLKVII